jgi:hypothetical protein
LGVRAKNALVSAACFTGSTETQLPAGAGDIVIVGIGELAELSENQFRLTKSPGCELRTATNTVCLPASIDIPEADRVAQFW